MTTAAPRPFRGRGHVLPALLLFPCPAWIFVFFLLGDNGLINNALHGLGLVEDSLPLRYNMFSVLIAMVQILLPRANVTLFGGMLRIDVRLVPAAMIHGATGWRAFRTVFFPLSLPGVYGAGLLVFVLALGFFVTPALLGSPKETMMAQTIMVEATQILDWPQASAAGMPLLVVTLATTTVHNRYFGLDRLWGGSEA